MQTVTIKRDTPEMKLLVIKKQGLSSFSILGKAIGVYRPLTA
jgi:hypothetical protein